MIKMHWQCTFPYFIFKTVNVCDPACANDGVCETQGTPGTCSCPAGYEGDTCETGMLIRNILTSRKLHLHVECQNYKPCKIDEYGRK